MRVIPPGPGLRALVASANERLVLVAPFIKSAALKVLLDHASEGLREVVCITRWKPEDIASGVCDLEILDQILALPSGRLLIQPQLHAKYYATETKCLVGSANITNPALGFSSLPNLELMVEARECSPELKEWEARLIASSIVATRQLRDAIGLEAERLRREKEGAVALGDSEELSQGGLWYPTFPVPDRLWEVYIGRADSTMVSAALAAAQSDLQALGIPDNLPQGLFVEYVSSVLRSSPVIEHVDTLAATGGFSDAEGLSYLETELGLEGAAAAQVWRTIKAWMMYFFPREYRIETGQEVIVKGRRL